MLAVFTPASDMASRCVGNTSSGTPSAATWLQTTRTNDGQMIKDLTATDSDQAHTCYFFRSPDRI
jgi:hypothetical protein